MRIFQTLQEAYDEVGRDLAKGPIVESTRVQNMAIDTLARERFGYSFMIQQMPQNVHEFVDIWAKFQPVMSEEKLSAYKGWIINELFARLHPIGSLALGPAEKGHPALAQVQEGKHWSYTYAERMVGMLEVLATDLYYHPDTRRAFWPVFHPEDAFRANAKTRIPCTLGYDFMIREVNGVPQLLCFYIMRSSDYDTFLLSDLFFASRLQAALCEKLRSMPDFNYKDTLVQGGLVYFSASLHSFTVGEIEIY